VLHGEQSFVLHQELPPAATVVAINRVRDVVDKGEGKGALLYVEREIRHRTGAALATLTSTYFCRADGGFGGSTTVTRKPPVMPSRAPDAVADLPIDKRAALIYRLSGDYNPIHADPRAAEAAGFKAPIFHGLGSFGIAAHALLSTLCDYDPARLIGMSLRFTAPVYPGETLRTLMWRSGTHVFFRCEAVERSIVVLDSGLATLRD
jgi:acyl dehydratase